jgi:hypothetical protein
MADSRCMWRSNTWSLSSAVRRRSLKPQPETLNLLNFFQALTVQGALCRNLKTLEGCQTNGRTLIWTYILFQKIECVRRPDDTQQRKKKATATVVVVVVGHPWLVVSISLLVPPPLLPLFFLLYLLFYYSEHFAVSPRHRWSTAICGENYYNEVEALGIFLLKVHISSMILPRASLFSWWFDCFERFSWTNYKRRSI